MPASAERRAPSAHLAPSGPPPTEPPGANASAAAVQSICSVAGADSVYVGAWATKYFAFYTLSAIDIEIGSTVGGREGPCTGAGRSCQKAWACHAVRLAACVGLRTACSVCWINSSLQGMQLQPGAAAPFLRAPGTHRRPSCPPSVLLRMGSWPASLPSWLPCRTALCSQ